MMSCDSLNLTIRQETSFARLLVIKDGAGEKIDLTGYQFKSVAKLQYASEVAFTFSFSIKNQTTNRGEVDWTMAADETEDLDITDDTVYIYDVLMIQPDTDPKAIIYGEIIVQPVITTP